LPGRFRSGLFRFLVRFCRSFGGGFGVGQRAEMGAQFFRDIHRNRTRVRLFFGDAEPGQKVNNRLRLDLEVAREFVDPDLIRAGHPLLASRPFLRSLAFIRLS
jgi:hypothetical protein